MGLAEKRAIKDFQDNIYPGIETELKAALKTDVPIEINWESLAVDNQGHRYTEALPAIYFTPLVKALSSITQDDMGAEALKEALKKIEIKNVEGRSDCYTAKFANGVLEIDTGYSNEHAVSTRTDSIQSTLEQAL